MTIATISTRVMTIITPMITVRLLLLWGRVRVDGDVLSLPVEVVVSIGKQEHIHIIKLGQLSLGGEGHIALLLIHVDLLQSCQSLMYTKLGM